MTTQDFAAWSARDWTSPTNAVPGVEERVFEKLAGDPSDKGPEPPVFTLQGFGGKSPFVQVPNRLCNVPGVGEDYSVSYPGRETDSTAMAPAGESDREQGNALARNIYACAVVLLESARRAGRAARELCQNGLLREQLHLLSQEQERAAEVQKSTTAAQRMRHDEGDAAAPRV